MRSLLFALLSIFLYSASALSQTHHSQAAYESPVPHIDSTPTTTHKPSQHFDYGRLPLSFEANIGQIDERVKFLSHGSGYELFLAEDEAVVVLKKFGHATDAPKEVAGLEQETNANGVANTVRMQLVGANAESRVVGADELPGKVNYFIGKDPSEWRANISTYAKVRYEGIYPGVDLVYYGNQGRLEYDFIVSPGTPTNSIALHFQANKKVAIDSNGDLLVQVENVRFQKPRIYQKSETGRKEIDGRYRLTAANTVGFVVGDYDRSKPLIIDPVLVYSTYLGGSAIDQPGGIAVDAAENAYITGTAQSSDYPTLNAIQPIQKSAQDIFITKINAAGSALVYSTFLGGTNEDFGMGIAVDPAGNAYVTGQTYSNDFPVVNALEPTQATCCGPPALRGSGFVVKLNASGSALIYSTYLGGAGLDFGAAVAADAGGNAYVTGKTAFDAFPVTATAPQKHLGGKPGYTYNAFVSEINPDGSAFVFSTYLGGNGVLNPDHTVEFNAGDEGLGIAVDPEGNIYVTGGVESPDFPTINALQSKLKGSSAAFVAKYKAGGGGLIYSTLLSGSGLEQGLGVAADHSGNAYVTGETFSTDFPLVNPLQSVLPFPATSFLTKINPTGSALVYSTYFGPGLYEVGGIVVDQLGNVYVAGSTDSTDFPVVNAFQPTYGGGEGDVLVAEINASGSAVVYASYLGGSGFDLSGTGFTRGIAIDPLGNVYVTGGTDSKDFPTVNPLQAHQTGFAITFVSKIGSTIDSRLNLSGQEFLTGHPCTIDSQSATCDAFTVGWSGGSGHSPNGWVPFPGDGNAAWEASVNYTGDVAFGKTVNLQGGTLALLLNPSKLLSEKVTEGKITWPSSATQDIGCGQGVGTVHAWFTSTTGGSASFVGCLHDLPAGSVVPPKIWGTFFHVTGHE